MHAQSLVCVCLTRFRNVAVRDAGRGGVGSLSIWHQLTLPIHRGAVTDLALRLCSVVLTICLSTASWLVHWKRSCWQLLIWQNWCQLWLICSQPSLIELLILVISLLLLSLADWQCRAKKTMGKEIKITWGKRSLAEVLCCSMPVVILLRHSHDFIL